MYYPPFHSFHPSDSLQLDAPRDPFDFMIWALFQTKNRLKIDIARGKVTSNKIEHNQGQGYFFTDF